MTFGRWLLIHSFSIFLVVILVLGYIYREELKLEQAYSQILDLGNAETVVKSLKQDEQQQASPDKLDAVKTVDNSTIDGQEMIATSPAEKQSLVTAPTVVHAETNQQDLLFDAREAYWQRDYQAAIGKYRNLIDSDPQNPDYSGELGNIYYAMNDYRNASELYFRTAMLLLEQGQRDEAGQLLSPLNAMNRQLGDQLSNELKRR